MNPETQKLIEQKAKRLYPRYKEPQTFDQVRYHAFIAGAKFYEETILPGVLEEELKPMVEMGKRIYEVVGRDYKSLEDAVVSRLKDILNIALKNTTDEKDLRFLNEFNKRIIEFESYKSASTQSTEGK